MEFKVADLVGVLSGEILKANDQGSVIIKISGKQHSLRLLRSGTSEFEFILDNTYHQARIIQSSSAEVKILIDGVPVIVKKHSKLTEVLEKASAFGGFATGDRNLTSQIPGRVVSVNSKPGTEVRKGDVILVLESMKMQVAVKAHKDGNLKELRVKQGASVARNDVLAVIE